jgi:AcrR family transcriptional regulator
MLEGAFRPPSSWYSHGGHSPGVGVLPVIAQGTVGGILAAGMGKQAPAKPRTESRVNGGSETPSGRVVPKSRRGARTRQALIDSAREIFERDGYLDVRITDISEHAGVAAGSFYTYFDSKEEMFAAVIAELQEDMLHPDIGELDPSAGVAAAIEANNRAYLEAYRRNAKLMSLFEQVSHVDDDLRAMRRDRSREFAKRNAKTIRRLQKEGKADHSVDPDLAARALSSMVGRTAYQSFVLEEGDIPFENLVQTVTRLWLNALKIDS